MSPKTVKKALKDAIQATNLDASVLLSCPDVAKNSTQLAFTLLCAVFVRFLTC